MADVGMVQRRNGARLALHALLQFRRRRKMGSQNFHGDGAIEARIARAIDLAHAARAKRRLDFVGTELCARGETSVGAL